MKKFTLRSIFLTMIAGLGLILRPIHMVALTPGPTANAPHLSEEDVKFLEDLGKQIQKEVEQLPSRDQLRAQGLSEEQVQKANTKEKFDEDVKRYSAMSEEELFAEMEKALAEVEKAGALDAAPEYSSTPIYQGEQEAAPIAPVVAPKPSVPSNKQQAAIQLIDSLLASLTNFLSKSQVMVELSGKISSWVKEGKLRHWPTTLTWNSFRSQVEELQAKLNKIKDKDTKLGTYKYLDDLIKDEGTYNNLVKLKDALAKSVSKIELGSFGIDKMTTQGRQAIRDALLSLHEGVSTLAIPASLDKIIEKYEPTAKKHKESEEAAAKRALEESRRGRTPGYATVGGYPKQDDNYHGRYDFDRGGRYSPGTFDAPAREKDKPLEDKKDAKAGGAAGGTKADAKKPEDKKPTTEKPKREEDKRADELAKDFNNSVYQIIDALETNSHLAKIEHHMNDDTFVNEDVYKEGIPSLVEGINKALRATKLLKRQLSRKTLTDDQKKEFKKEIRDGYNKDIKGDLEKLSKQLENVSKSGASVLVPGVASKNELFTQAKMYAYFGKKNDAAFKAKIDEVKAEVAAARATATAANTSLAPNIERKDADVKLAEDLYNKKESADLSKLNDKIKELQKAVNEL